MFIVLFGIHRKRRLEYTDQLSPTVAGWGQAAGLMFTLYSYKLTSPPAVSFSFFQNIPASAGMRF